MIDKAVKAGEWFEPHLAFPNGIHTGMTLRDYFAAQALTGAQIWDAVLNGKEAHFSNGVDKLAEVAYAVADAMLEERNK